MFRTGSPYSPFFTSGLLSEPASCSPPSSRSASPEPPVGPRRGSLPTDSQSTRSSHSADEPSAFYFTLQPKRGQSEFRSFLSLDLAESQSLRSASMRRKTYSSRVVTSGSARPEKPSFSAFTQIPEVPRQLAPPTTSLRVRLSRDSLRTIPSPKPAPCTTLPDVPRFHLSSSASSISCIPPRLPPIVINPSLGLSLERASQSAPSLAIAHTPSPTTSRRFTDRSSTITQTTSSSISTCARKVNRSDALARLEGRSDSTGIPPYKRVERNFMSMSDGDDDDDDESESDTSDFNDSHSSVVVLKTTLEPEDIVLPPYSSLRLQASKSVPSSCGFPSLSSSRSFSPRRKLQQRKTKDWFPLQSFIDLHNDDEISGWTWRSFMEVAGVS